MEKAQPSLEKPYFVIYRFDGVWYIDTFDTLPKAHDFALELHNIYSLRAIAHRIEVIGVSWLLTRMR